MMESGDSNIESYFKYAPHTQKLREKQHDKERNGRSKQKDPNETFR